MKKKHEKSSGELAFDSQIGSTAKIEHHIIPNDSDKGQYMCQLREVLAEMAKDLQDRKVAQPDFDYMGSFSIHIYASSALPGTYEFVPVSNPHKCFFKLAEAAGKKMAGDIQQMFTGKFQKLRSGFASGG